jgi:hypothetical protein
MATAKSKVKKSATRTRTAAGTPNAKAVEAQVRQLIARYSPQIAADMRAARARLRELFPRGCELVYDNYNALAIGFASTERAGDAIVSIAGYPKWVTLFFLHGAKLEDPGRLLQGEGSRVRSIRLAPLTLLDDARVLALMRRALAPHKSALRLAPPLRTIIKSVSARQRSRRPPPTVARPSSRA